MEGWGRVHYLDFQGDWIMSVCHRSLRVDGCRIVRKIYRLQTMHGKCHCPEYTPLFALPSIVCTLDVIWRFYLHFPSFTSISSYLNGGMYLPFDGFERDGLLSSADGDQASMYTSWAILFCSLTWMIDIWQHLVITFSCSDYGILGRMSKLRLCKVGIVAKPKSRGQRVVHLLCWSTLRTKAF